MSNRPRCRVPECTAPTYGVHTDGLCRRHWDRFKRTGSTQAQRRVGAPVFPLEPVLAMYPEPPEERKHAEIGPITQLARALGKDRVQIHRWIHRGGWTP